MSDQISSLAALLDPFDAEAFRADYLHKRPLHVAGRPGKFAASLSWDELNRMLAMDVWTQQTLQLYADTRRVPPAAYCVNTMSRDRQPVMRPEPAKVQELIARGATLLLNEIESLAPGVLALVEAVQEGIGAKSSANLYLSCKARKGFDSHSDRHDVFAVQLFGRKRWNVYEGQLDNPIEHAMFQNVPQADYDRLKGSLAEVVEMNAGDLLYLPRGRFHDALVGDGISVHLSVACNEPNGLDWLTQLWNRALRESDFRAVLPRPDTPAGREALDGHLRHLFERLGSLAFDPQGQQAVRNLRQGYGIARGGYDLPAAAGAGEKE